MAETEKFVYDVFVSYSSANKDWVRNDLLSALEKAGLKVCIDFRDFKAGKPAIKNMRDSVLESKHTLLVLTEAYLNSGWTDFENMLSQTIDPANREGRIVPLLKEKCKLPLEIGYLTYVNFFDPDDWDIAWKQLFEALGAPDKSKPDTSTPVTGSRDTWHLAHPYPMPPNFTGRVAEQKMLDDWLADNTNRLFILRALGGFGKSALTWQWINTHVNPAEWTKLVWWSFYEGDASFEHFIEETLKYLKLEVTQSKREQVDKLLHAMQSQKVLIIMDGFERVLRLYGNMNAAYQDEEEQKIEDNQLDCKDLNAEWFLKSVCSLHNIKSKVLMTTRLSPNAVKTRGEFMLGCHEEELTVMQKEDAVEFFRKQKIQGAHAEIEVACKAYGYHPLSLRILAGLITNDREKPGDIAVADRLDITDDIIQNKNHVLKVSYDTLSFAQQKLLSNMSCFRSSINYQALKVISNKPSWKRKNKNLLNEKLDNSLQILESHGLLNWDRQLNKYDIHPIVRRFAYDRLTASDRTTAHTRLVNYFEAVPKPEKVKTLEDLAPVIELYHHMVRAGNLDEAQKLLQQRFADALLYQFGAYQLYAELLRALFLDGEDKPPRLKREDDQAYILNALANAHGLSGQPRRAVPLFEMQNVIREKRGDKINLAITLGNMAIQQLFIGALSAAERNLRLSIDLTRGIAKEFWEGVGHQEFGHALSYRGAWQEVEQELDNAIAIQQKNKQVQTEGISNSYRALRFLLMARKEAIFDNRKSNIEYRLSAIESAQRSLELADETARIQYPYPRDYVRAYWLLGAAYCANNELPQAEENLSKALNLCRQINSVDAEADILLDLARLRYAQGDFKGAQEKASEALMITERCGYVLQGADVNLFLAQYALEQEQDKVKAKQYAEEAKKLATCDGPPYYYKVAYEEAEAMLKMMKAEG